MVEKYRVTRHNGRSGKNGVYNPKHNDRSFDISSVDHIDAEKKKHNGYWDCYQGYRTDERQNNGSRHFLSFEEVESRFYEETFSDFVNGQNARNIKNRHPERNRTTQDLLQDKRTCPEETIYQIGNIDGTVDPYELMMWVFLTQGSCIAGILISIFVKFFFFIDGENIYHRGPYFVVWTGTGDWKEGERFHGGASESDISSWIDSLGL